MFSSQLVGDISLWEAPAFEKNGANKNPNLKRDKSYAVEKEELQDIADTHYKRGYDACKKEMELEQHNIERVAQLLESIRDTIVHANQDLVKEVLSLSFTIARNVIDKEISADSDYYRRLLTTHCQKYSETLPSISMHPEDIKELVDSEHISIEEIGVTFKSDADLPQRSCVLDTGERLLDVSIETMLKQLGDPGDLPGNLPGDLPSKLPAGN